LHAVDEVADSWEEHDGRCTKNSTCEVSQLSMHAGIADVKAKRRAERAFDKDLAKVAKISNSKTA
jgi:hypothetical protein